MKYAQFIGNLEEGHLDYVQDNAGSGWTGRELKDRSLIDDLGLTEETYGNSSGDHYYYWTTLSELAKHGWELAFLGSTEILKRLAGTRQSMVYPLYIFKKE